MLARRLSLLTLLACAQGSSETRRPGGDYLVSLLPAGTAVSDGWSRKKPPRLSQGIESYYVRGSDGAWFIVFSAPSEAAQPLDQALREAMEKNTQPPAPLPGVDGEGEEGLFKLANPPMRFYSAVARHGDRQVFVIAGSHKQSEVGTDEARDFLRRIRFKGQISSH